MSSSSSSSPTKKSASPNLGSDAEAVRFASRDAAMIIRMRGLPFQTTEQQIRDFFAEPNQEEGSGIVEQGGILFVNRQDGRPSGDAFVLFTNEAAGRRALGKHKNRIGSRYIELFRTTQSEVQQLFNRSQKSPQTFQTVLSAPKKDCIRLRGLPYEAQVQQVVDFLGSHSRNIVFQGVHMIYNNQGHPSGEAFIQLDSENAAAQAAQAMHNKYMECGKKKRYIEVFQCSPEDMNLLLSTPIMPPQGSPTGHSPFPAQMMSGMMPTLIPMNQSFRSPPFSLFNQMSPPPLPNSPNQPNNALNLAVAAAMANGSFCFPTGFSGPPPMTMGAEQAFYASQLQQMPYYPEAAAALIQQQQQTNNTDATAAAILMQQNMINRGFYVPTPGHQQQNLHHLNSNGSSEGHNMMELANAAQQAHQFALIHT